MKQTISETVGKWVQEDNHPKGRRVTVIRESSPWHGMSEEEIEDRKEHIRCYLLKDLEPILRIPVKPRQSDFWFSSHQEFLESAFNTWDFERIRRPFDKYGYRIKKVIEQVEELAVLHSCISQSKGRKNIRDRFEMVVNEEFMNPLLELVERHRKSFDEERRFQLRHKITRLSRHILECKRIWERYSIGEDTPSQV